MEDGSTWSCDRVIAATNSDLLYTCGNESNDINAQTNQSQLWDNTTADQLEYTMLRI